MPHWGTGLVGRGSCCDHYALSRNSAGTSAPRGLRLFIAASPVARTVPDTLPVSVKLSSLSKVRGRRQAIPGVCGAVLNYFLLSFTFHSVTCWGLFSYPCKVSPWAGDNEQLTLHEHPMYTPTLGPLRGSHSAHVTSSGKSVLIAYPPEPLL